MLYKRLYTEFAKVCGGTCDEVAITSRPVQYTSRGPYRPGPGNKIWPMRCRCIHIACVLYGAGLLR